MRSIAIFLIFSAFVGCQPAIAEDFSNSSLVEWLKFIGLLTSIIGVMVTLHLANQKRIDERFDQERESRLDIDKNLRSVLSQISQHEKDSRDKYIELERKLLSLRAELPEKYLRREDWIRGQTLLEQKMDGLALKIENLQLRGNS